MPECITTGYEIFFELYSNHSSNNSNNNKMEQQTSANSPVANNYDNSYNYGQYSTFLPNVSPSASSLDSGYCGPASVQSMHSSIDSPHNNLGYPSSPWTTDLTVGDLAN